MTQSRALARNPHVAQEPVLLCEALGLKAGYKNHQKAGG
jgi:hypothetical protein